jgi:hypothetical protein
MPMSMTFENNHDGIVYAMEKIIACSRKHQNLFVAHCVWWLSAIIGFQQIFIVHIDHLQSQALVAGKKAKNIPEELVTSKVNYSTEHQNKMLSNRKESLDSLKKQRNEFISNP